MAYSKHTINGHYNCRRKMLNFSQKNINSDVTSFTIGCLHLPSSLEWTQVLNLEAARKRRYSLAGDSRKPLLRKQGIGDTQSMSYPPMRSHTHTHTHAPSPTSLGQMDEQKVSWNHYYFLEKLTRIIPTDITS